MDHGIVHLNVGGMKYSTSRDTLVKEDSFLKTLVSDEFGKNVSADGSYFIDQDGNTFRYILAWLRDSFLPPLEKHDLAFLKLQANYFCIQSLITELKNREKPEYWDMYSEQLVGMRVKRGPHWKWGEQDGNGYGTVVSPSGKCWVKVRWDHDKETNTYRWKYEEDGRFIYDVQIVSNELSDD